ncbi:hypothetical protein MTBPR1_110098 [Candidatus Terasakiella magnetica]|uniref:EAL domain-containing protein n=1 Tax=Candidatus Terasakiella magnetica TaxID=1867952 RepID=A0A1C3REG5_9PROT|nr:hypothetical protein [Candidatus Terasakiella magnetica]SCA55659.1 hypothetical protein MTBPR1_110098 [Candidatus Terasakiella magnetica]
MTSFFQSIIDRIFGSNETEEEMPDDGGLAEFAKNLAKQLEEEEKFGKKPSVKAEDVLHVQQGKHGMRAYLLDTSDFSKAIVKELRASVAPVCEGILKTRCGDKGTGYMHVDAFYAFHIDHGDPVEEYNAAITIIDEIGRSLLGDRYLTGEKRVQVPIAEVMPEDIINKNGRFNVKKAKKAIKLVRETKTHGPAQVDVKKSEVTAAQGSKDWVQNEVVKIEKDQGEWEEQVLKKKEKEQKEWQVLEHQKKEEEDKKQWESIEHKPKQKEEKQWEPLEKESPEKTTEQSWLSPTPESPKEVPGVKKKTPPAQTKSKITVQPTTLRQLGTIALAFRPSWQTKNQTINSYAGYIYRQNEGSTFQGEDIYPLDGNEKAITRIDKAVAKQAALHLEQVTKLDGKRIILPFHISSLRLKAQRSPLKALRTLNDKQRQSIWIEIIGITPATSPSQLIEAIKNQQDSFSHFGIRCDLVDISPSLIKEAQSQAEFLSADLASSNLQTHDLDRELANLNKIATSYKMDICTWGLRSKTELQLALQEGSGFINGPALAKDMPKPGKVIPVPVEKLLGH